LIKPKTIADLIFEHLKESILNIDVPPGSKISESQIAKKFEVSRAPVRDAIQRLHQENLVLVRPQVGTIVSPIASPEKAVEICEIRILLEPFAAERAVGKISPEEKKHLSVLFKKLENQVPETPQYDQLLFETDVYLHNSIWERAGNREIKRILTSYKREIKRIQFTNMKLVSRSKESENEMRNIFQTILENNATGCKEAMRVHVYNLKQALVMALQDSTKSEREM